jgi:hypothetical protein
MFGNESLFHSLSAKDIRKINSDATRNVVQTVYVLESAFNQKMNAMSLETIPELLQPAVSEPASSNNVKKNGAQMKLTEVSSNKPSKLSQNSTKSKKIQQQLGNTSTRCVRSSTLNLILLSIRTLHTSAKVDGLPKGKITDPMHDSMDALFLAVVLRQRFMAVYFKLDPLMSMSQETIADLHVLQDHISALIDCVNHGIAGSPDYDQWRPESMIYCSVLSSWCPGKIVFDQGKLVKAMENERRLLKFFDGVLRTIEKVRFTFY